MKAYLVAHLMNLQPIAVCGEDSFYIDDYFADFHKDTITGYVYSAKPETLTWDEWVDSFMDYAVGSRYLWSVIDTDVDSKEEILDEQKRKAR